LFSRLHKEQRTIVKSLRRKNICNQKEICNQEFTIKKKSAVKKEFAVKKDCSNFKFFRFYKNARNINQKRSLRQHKEIDLRSSNAFFFLFAKIYFQVLRINTFEKKDNCHDLTSLHINFTH
jgi:hypothetical protein